MQKFEGGTPIRVHSWFGSLKPTGSLSLKINAWKMIFVASCGKGLPIFRSKLAVSFRECQDFGGWNPLLAKKENVMKLATVLTDNNGNPKLHLKMKVFQFSLGWRVAKQLNLAETFGKITPIFIGRNGKNVKFKRRYFMIRNAWGRHRFFSLPRNQVNVQCQNFRHRQGWGIIT